MLLLLALAAPAVAPSPLAQDFDAPRLLHVETAQLVSGLADMNGDGHADLVSHAYDGPDALIYTSKVLVQLGYGAGAFAQAATSSAFPPAEAVVSSEPVVLGDFDGDGAVDVAFAQVGTASQPFYYLLGNGDGTLQAPVADIDMFRRDNPPVAIQWDSDPEMEIAWVRRVPTQGVIELVPEILEWNGSGFSTIATAANGLPQPDAASLRSKLTVDDLNGDGRGELVVVDRQNQKIRIYSNANGSMAQLTAFDLNAEADPGGGPLPLGDTGAITGDFDGDGDADLLAYHLRRMGFGFSTDPLGLRTTWIENQQPGAFVIHPAVNVTFDDQGLSNVIVKGDLRAVDWDQDGDDDLAGPIGNLGQFVFSLGAGSSVDSFATEVHLFENTGGAIFGSPGRRVNPGQVVLAGVEDVDGDGADDLVTHARVIYGDGSFADGPQFEQVPLVAVPSAKADFEGDGDFDYLQVQGSVFSALGINYINDGTGSLATVSNSAIEGLQPSSYISRVAFGDFDGDGGLELIGTVTSFTDPFIGTQFDSGLGTLELGADGVWDLTAIQTLTQYPQATHPLAVDVDQDGDLDLLDGTRYYPNDGSGFFGSPVPKFIDQTITAAADVDADGDLDFTTIESVMGIDTVRVRLTDPSGDQLVELGQQSSPVLSPFGSTLPTGVQRFVDADGDGDLDVISSLFSDGVHGAQIALLENLGSGFAPPVALDVPGSNDSFEDLAIEDTDGDGVLDLAVLMRSTVGVFGTWSMLTVFHGTGAGLGFDSSERYLVTNNFALLDMDSDGDLDVLGGYGITRGLASAGAGSIRQYGAGSLGSGDTSPLLGATGPLVPGSPDATARIVRGVGGAPAWIAIGNSELDLANAPLPGLTLYVDGLTDLLPVVLGGAPGVPGQGSLVLPVPIGPELAGLQIYAEAFLVDAASPSLVTHSNGLELTFGQ